jgi:HEAT repeat protein
MRPKVVILTLVVAFGLLGMIAVMKGLGGKHAGDSGTPSQDSTAKADSSSVGTNADGSPAAASGNPVVSDELRAALIDKEIEQIQQLQGEVDGTNNPVIIQALIEKAGNPEAEVRKAAVEALRELNDTNAIPGLQKLADGIQDAREKVAVLDVIDYLKLPNIMPDNAPIDTDTNIFAPSKVAAGRMNPQFMSETQKKKQRHSQQRAASQDSQTAQPQ